MMQRIKKGDTVVVTTGKSRGHVGLVLCVSDGKLKVEGAAKMKKHVKPNPHLNVKGGIVEQESWIDVSNVAMYNAQTKKADKVGFRYLEKDGKSTKVRYFKSNQELIDVI